jgi:exopolysaccharide production protein ExoY
MNCNPRMLDLRPSMPPFGDKTPKRGSPVTIAVPMPGWKRALDIVCCLIAMPVLALFTLVTSIVMQLTSPGPVFFRQERVGYRGRRFMCYKFRTMLVGADCKTHQTHCDYLIQSNAPMVKMDSRGDSRLIPGGWLIRASGLDELPQIINVLRGEMSLIGPRPCVPYEYEKYLPWQRERFNAVPGLTGLWQVSGKNRTTFEEMIRLDIQYSRTVSFWLDLKIVILTIPALLVQVSDTVNGKKSVAQLTPPTATAGAETTGQRQTT